MRVAMLMPMAQESAIADVMLQAVPHLSAGWDLEVWHPVTADPRSCPVPVRSFGPADAETVAELESVDLVVYVLGNSPLHSHMLPLMREVPGLVVLHDASMTDLVRQTAVNFGVLHEVAREIERRHGADVAAAFRSGDPRKLGLDWMRFCAEYPLSDLIIRGSLGAVVHSSWHAGLVDGLTLGDVSVAPLPVPSTRTRDDGTASLTGSTHALDRLPADAVLAVTVGAVNANRRIETILAAVSDDPALATRVHLWAVGPAESRTRQDLLSVASMRGLADRFRVTGRVTDDVLQAILARADVALALRDPVLEGQSASVLTQMLSGTPVIVFDHGHYAELPDDAVVKVEPSDGAAGLRVALHALVDDEPRRVRAGEAARDYVLTSRSGSAYADVLLDAGERAVKVKAVAHTGADVAARLRRLGLHREPAVTDAVSDLLLEMFDLA